MTRAVLPPTASLAMLILMIFRPRRLNRMALTVLAPAVVLMAASFTWQRPTPVERIEPRPIAWRICVNTADAAELQLLPGIGPGIARNIVEHRRDQGLFHEPADLEAVHLIGPTRRQRIEPWIRFDQPEEDSGH